jgi:hypothetical protein
LVVTCIHHAEKPPEEIMSEISFGAEYPGGNVYTPDQLNMDVQAEINFFLELVQREARRIKHNITNDFKTPKQNWHTVYQEILDLSRKMGRDTTPLQRALDEAQQAFEELEHLADVELANIQHDMRRRVTVMDVQR